MLRMLDAVVEETEVALSVGASVDVWQPHTNSLSRAKIIEISGSSIELLYDDGKRKVHLPSEISQIEIIPRIAIGKVFNACVA